MTLYSRGQLFQSCVHSMSYTLASFFWTFPVAIHPLRHSDQVFSTWFLLQVTLSPHAKRSPFLSYPSFILHMNSVFLLLKHGPMGALTNRWSRFVGVVLIVRKAFTPPMQTVSMEYMLTLRQASCVGNMSAKKTAWNISFKKWLVKSQGVSISSDDSTRLHYKWTQIHYHHELYLTCLIWCHSCRKDFWFSR